MEYDEKMERKEQAMMYLCQLVADTLKVAPDVVKPDSGPLTLPEWDSFNHMHLMVSVEERYKVGFEADEIASMISVADILRVLNEKGVVST